MPLLTKDNKLLHNNSVLNILKNLLPFMPPALILHKQQCAEVIDAVQSELPHLVSSNADLCLILDLNFDNQHNIIIEELQANLNELFSSYKDFTAVFNRLNQNTRAHDLVFAVLLQQCGQIFTTLSAFLPVLRYLNEDQETQLFTALKGVQLHTKASMEFGCLDDNKALISFSPLRPSIIINLLQLDAIPSHFLATVTSHSQFRTLLSLNNFDTFAKVMSGDVANNRILQEKWNPICIPPAAQHKVGLLQSISESVRSLWNERRPPTKSNSDGYSNSNTPR